MGLKHVASLQSTNHTTNKAAGGGRAAATARGTVAGLIIRQLFMTKAVLAAITARGY